jgi:RNA polymerase sigma-70 factor, ECF subfamily
MLPMLPINEQGLVEAAQRGDEHAFRRLIEPHRDRLRSRCYRVLRSQDDADDALQETLVRAWRGLRGLDHDRSVGPWLHRIATNSSLDALDRRRRTVPIDSSADPDAEAAGRSSSPAIRYEQSEAVMRTFTDVIQHLPDRQRKAVVLDALGFTPRETARALNTTRPSVYSALQRARKVIGESPQPLADAA